MRNKNHVDQFTIVGFDKKNSSNIGIGCSFFSSVKGVMFFLCTVEHESIIKSIFFHKYKTVNRRRSAKQAKVCDAKLQGL